MAKHRRMDHEAAAALDQMLLELFAGQLLLEPAGTKRSVDPAVRPVGARAKGMRRHRPTTRAKKEPGGGPPGSSKDQGG
jgi:hypothetical protein